MRLFFSRTRRWPNSENSLLLGQLYLNWWLAMSFYPRCMLLSRTKQGRKNTVQIGQHNRTQFKLDSSTEHSSNWTVQQNTVQIGQRNRTQFKLDSAIEHSSNWTVQQNTVQIWQRNRTQFKLDGATEHSSNWTVQQNTVQILIFLYYLSISECKVTPKAYSGDWRRRNQKTLHKEQTSSSLCVDVNPSLISRTDPLHNIQASMSWTSSLRLIKHNQL